MTERTTTAVIHVETYRTDRDLFRDAQSRLQEAIELAKAIDLEVVFERVIQLKKIDSGLLIGKGHIDEIRQAIEDQEITLLIVNHQLSPIQQRNLERKLNIKVIDRTALILEIFGERAATREGRLQVDAAALKYQKSRLVRSWTHLERQRGGRGFLGGPGETQIEADRRAIDTQIQAIEARLDQVKRTRGLHRANRKRNAIPVVALVGYTNAGKSTLFNRLSNADVMAQDMLFATLDPVMRNVALPSGREIVLSDTVGFISDLPTELIAAFRATLEEVEFADIILHVRDASSNEQASQAKDVWKILNSLGISVDGGTPKVIEVLNKIDLVNDREWLHDQYDTIKISAITGEGIDGLLDKIEHELSGAGTEAELRLTFNNGAERAWLHQNKLVEQETSCEDGVVIRVKWTEEMRQRYEHRFGSIQGDQQNG